VVWHSDNSSAVGIDGRGELDGSATTGASSSSSSSGVSLLLAAVDGDGAALSAGSSNGTSSSSGAGEVEADCPTDGLGFSEEEGATSTLASAEVSGELDGDAPGTSEADELGTSEPLGGTLWLGWVDADGPADPDGDGAAPELAGMGDGGSGDDVKLMLDEAVVWADRVVDGVTDQDLLAVAVRLAGVDREGVVLGDAPSDKEAVGVKLGLGDQGMGAMLFTNGPVTVQQSGRCWQARCSVNLLSIKQVPSREARRCWLAYKQPVSFVTIVLCVAPLLSTYVAAKPNLHLIPCVVTRTGSQRQGVGVGTNVSTGTDTVTSSVTDTVTSCDTVIWTVCPLTTVSESE
jgi:hypothetical protein